ncbi:MAG: hypothetical protein ACR2N8_04970, partial [Parvibaculales bacterium]
AAGAAALGITNPQIVSLMVKQSNNTFSHQLVAQEDPTALPALGYTIATQATIDCPNTVCKGINTRISTTAATTFDDTTATLDASGFAVDGGYAYFVRSNPLLTLTTAVDTKVQIHGFVYLGDVSTPAATDADNNPILDDDSNPVYRFNIASGGDFAFASVSGGGNFELTNYGAIIGSGNVLISLADLTSGKIYNEGNISAAKAAIKFADASGTDTFQLTNKGSIGADGEAIIVDGGVVTIDNSGGISSSIELAANVQGGDGVHSTIHVGNNNDANANAAVTIINRQGGKIRYRIGSIDTGTPASAPIYASGLANLKIYNAGDIIISKGANADDGIEDSYAIFWNGNVGSISNSGRIIGIKSAIHIIGSSAIAISDITIHNNGLIRSSEDTINFFGGLHKVSIFNYEDGTLSTIGAGEVIRANKYGEFYLTNHGLITSASVTTVFVKEATKAADAIAAHKKLIYNTGRIVNSRVPGQTGRAIRFGGSGFLFNIGADALISGTTEAIYLDKGHSSTGGRELLTLVNSGRILSSAGYGIRVGGTTNTSVLVDNLGVISGATSGIFISVGKVVQGSQNAKVDILNKAGGGIYGDESAIHVVAIGPSASDANLIAEQFVITNDGDIFSKDIAIKIDDSLEALDITNGPNGAIVAKTNELDREAFDETIAIDVSNVASGGPTGDYGITNMGRILSNSIAHRDLGYGHFNNTGFILGDIIIAGQGSTFINRVDANNDFKKDLFGKVGERSYSFLIDPSKVASGVIVGNIYFYDRSVVAASRPTNRTQTLTNSGIIYGNIDFGKGNDIYNHEGNGRVEGTVTLGVGADKLNVNSGTMYLNVTRDRLV